MSNGDLLLAKTCKEEVTKEFLVCSFILKKGIGTDRQLRFSHWAWFCQSRLDAVAGMWHDP